MAIELFTEDDLFNGFKCSRSGTPVVDLTRTELVAFIGLLDFELTRAHRRIAEQGKEILLLETLNKAKGA